MLLHVETQFLRLAGQHFKMATTGKILGKSPPKRQRPGKHFGSHRQNGDDRGNTSEVTAKTATTGETLRKSLPKWRRPGKHFGSHRQNGDDRGDTSEVTAKMATTGEMSRRCASLSCPMTHRLAAGEESRTTPSGAKKHGSKRESDALAKPFISIVFRIFRGSSWLN